MPADLHCHTKLSDGSATIEEVVYMARRMGLTTIAVTDHDTQAGVARAVLMAKKYGITVIPGVELSAYDYARERKVHLLCYLPDSPGRLEGLCKQTLDSRSRANRRAAEFVIQHFPVSAEMINKRATGSTALYKQHIMHALVDAGCADRIFGRMFDFLFGREGKAHVPVEYPDIFEALALVKDAGGIAVLAHPYAYDSLELLPELVKRGLDGVEAWHPRQTEEQTAHLQKLAEEAGLLLTGGTDFHGGYAPRAQKIGKFVTPDDHLKKLLNYKHKHNKA